MRTVCRSAIGGPPPCGPTVRRPRRSRLTTIPPPVRPAPRDLRRSGRGRRLRRPIGDVGPHRWSRALAAHQHPGPSGRPASLTREPPRSASLRHGPTSFRHRHNLRTPHDHLTAGMTSSPPRPPPHTERFTRPYTHKPDRTADGLRPAGNEADRTAVCLPTRLQEADKTEDKRPPPHHAIRPPTPQTATARSRQRARKPKAQRPARCRSSPGSVILRLPPPALCLLPS
jgi:hypothetical protein